MYNSTVFQLRCQGVTMHYIIALLLLSGCASSTHTSQPLMKNPSLTWFTKTLHPHYTWYDPCFRCGDTWSMQIPNKRFEAQDEPDAQNDW